MAYSLFDRYFSKDTNVTETQKKLAAVTMLHISAKYEEIYAPKLSKYSRFLYSPTALPAVVEFESDILQALEFELCVPNPLTSFELYCYELEVSPAIKTHGQYLIESMLMNSSWLSYRPVTIVISALYSASVYCRAKDLTKHLLERLKDWDITQEEMAKCLKDMTMQA